MFVFPALLNQLLLNSMEKLGFNAIQFIVQLKWKIQQKKKKSKNRISIQCDVSIEAIQANENSSQLFCGSV